MEKADSTEKLEFMIRSTILDRPRLLVIDPQYIEFDDQNRASASSTRFVRSEIEGLRYGVNGIRGYRFRIGRIYCIDVRDISGRVIRIRLKSVYRVRRKLLEEKYLDITNALFRYYFHDTTRQYLQQFQEGQTIELPGVRLNSEGVLFDEKTGWISWEESPENYRAFVFLEDWNAGVLRGLIEIILKEKFPNR